MAESRPLVNIIIQFKELKYYLTIIDY